MTETELDIREEIEPFLDRFAHYKFTDKELVSCSPFREDSSPSFSLNLETGLWIDFGTSSDIWGRGNFFKLIAYLTGEQYEDVYASYMLKFKGILNDMDKYTLDIKLAADTEYKTFDLADFPYYNVGTSYLTRRGITPRAQKTFSIGYDPENKAIAIPYRDKEGNVVNIKFRKVRRKQFYYLPDGQPIGNHVYGLDKIIKHKFTEAYVVESEIDCLYLWSYGYPAIALGSAHMSARQEQLIKLSPIETLILALDNDRAGKKAADNIAKRLLANLTLRQLVIPSNAKDVNDIPKEVLQNKELVTRNYVKTFTIL